MRVGVREADVCLEFGLGTNAGVDGLAGAGADGAGVGRGRGGGGAGGV